MHLSRRAFWWSIAGVFVLALVVRGGMTWAFVGFASPPDAEANSDQVDYELLAQRLSTSGEYAIRPGVPTATRTPGTSLALLPVYELAGRSWSLGRGWFVMLSAATCAVVALLAAACFGRAAGLAAGLLLAVYPGHAYYAMHFLSETPFGLYLSLALLLTALAARHGALWLDLAAGAMWGMAILCRPQLVLAAPVALGFILLSWRTARWPQLRRWAIQTAVVLAVLTPWIARNALVMGAPTLTTISGHGLWGSHNAITFNNLRHRGDWVKTSILQADHPLTGGEVARDAQAKRYALDAIRENAVGMPALVAMKLWRLASPWKDTENGAVRGAFAAAWLVVAPLTAVGGVSAWRRRRSEAMLLLVPIAATVLTAAIFYGSDRFRDSTAAAFVPLAGLGAVRAIVWITSAVGLAKPQAMLDGYVEATALR